MLTVGEIDKLLRASEVFKSSVEKLIKLESMKAENKMREINGGCPAYGEEHFLELLRQ